MSTPLAVTPINIIEKACRLARLAPELQPIDNYKIQRGLEVFNDMVREWGNSENYIPLQSVLTLNLFANQETYKIGLNTNIVTYDLDTAPIINLLECNVVYPDSDLYGFYKVEIITELMYSNIFFRQSQGIPSWVLVRLWPTYTELKFQVPPFATLVCEMLVKQQLQPVANTALSVPVGVIPGFAIRAMAYHIAKELMLIFGKAQTPDFTSAYQEAIQAYLDNNIDVDPYVKHDVTLNKRVIYTTYPGFI